MSCSNSRTSSQFLSFEQIITILNTFIVYSIFTFADDTTIYDCNTSANILQNNLQSDVETIVKWCDLNKMALNPNKSTSMLLGSPYNTRRSSDISIKVKGQFIECVCHQKLLGLHIDKNLTWNHHIKVVHTKLKSKLALLRRIKPFLNKDMRLLFYNGYVMPIFDYGCVIWSNSTDKYLNKIINTQKRAARMILDKRYDQPSAPLFNELAWLPFMTRCKYHIGKLVFKTINNLLPSYMNEMLLINTSL